MTSIMTSTGTILKAMQAVLLVTVLTPATVFAGSLNTHQAAQIQTQDQPASGDAKHLKRGLILTPAEAATNPAVAPQVEIPPLPPRHDEETAGTAANNYSTAAAPAQTTSTAQSASVVTLPAQPPTDTAPASVTNTTTDTAPAPVAPAAPAATAAPTPAAVATPATTSAGTTTTPAVTTPTGTTAPTRTAQTSHQSRSRHHSDDSFNVGGFNISSSNIQRQATKFFNRRDVKSALAQFGF